MTFRSKKIKKEPVKVNCIFCKKESLPDYKETALLVKYISDRGKILGRDKTSLCLKHQKRLTKAIKRARYLALLPFVVKA